VSGTTKDPLGSWGEGPTTPLTLSGLSPNSIYYIEVFTYFAGFGGQGYTLTVTGY